MTDPLICFVLFVLFCFHLFVVFQVCLFNNAFHNPFGIKSNLFVSFTARLILCSAGVQRCVQGRVHRPSPAARQRL